jgi:hypothetical protein
VKEKPAKAYRELLLAVDRLQALAGEVRRKASDLDYFHRRTKSRTPNRMLTRREADEWYCLHVIRDVAGGNRALAARILDCSPKTVYAVEERARSGNNGSRFGAAALDYDT